MKSTERALLENRIKRLKWMGIFSGGSIQISSTDKVKLLESDYIEITDQNGVLESLTRLDSVITFGFKELK